MNSARATIIHLAPYARLRRRAVQLDRCGYALRKREAIDRALPQAVLMVITAGRGSWRRGTATSELQAPCAAFLRPGTRYTYQPQGAWQEWFLTFSSCPSELSADLPQDPWPVAPGQDLATLLAQLRRLSQAPGRPGGVDRLDLLAEQILLAARPHAMPDHGPDAIERAEAWMRQHLAREISIAELARMSGCSQATLRRRWRERYGTSPLRHLLALRMSHARAALSQPDRMIGAVAAACGFSDQRHFATVFRREHGCSPSTWRTGG